MNCDINVANIKKNPKKMIHIIRCIAAWIAQQYPGLTAKEHTEKTFLAVVRLHLGLDVATAAGEGLNQIMFIKPTKKAHPSDKYITDIVDNEFTTEIRQFIGVAAALARKDKRAGEQRSLN